MPGVAGLTPARFALGLSADFLTAPGLIFFYSFRGRIAVTWRIGGRLTCLWRNGKRKVVGGAEDFEVLDRAEAT
jgi:hypothetical protein